MRLSALLGLSLLLALPRISAAAPGDLDTTFGGTGVVVTAVTSGFDAAWDVLVQPDGKIVTAGQARATTTDFSVIRYNPDGTLDGTFGTGGIAVTPIGTGDEIARGIVQQPDGKLVVAGYSRIGSTNDFALVRYNTDGSLDAAFGSGGIVTTPIGAGHDNAFAVALQPDGKIVAAGYATFATLDWAVVRYDADGSLDGTFGTGGIFTTPIGTEIDVANDVLIQPDGKVVVAGYTAEAGIYEIAVLRLDASGAPDAGFDGDGLAITDVGPLGYAVGSAVVIQGDGRIVVAGVTRNGSGDNDFALARFNSDGSLDASFDGDGKLFFPVGPGGDTARGLVLESSGDLVAGGFAHDGSTNRLALAKVAPDGSLVASFGTGGLVTTDVIDNDGGNAVAQQADGKLVLVGFAGPPSTPDTVVARYENAVCGDATIQSGEVCDEGASNGAADSCCSAICTLVTAGTECRPAAGACDVEEVCDGSSPVCPSDVGLPDTDADTVCDAIDNCATIANPTQDDADADVFGDACDPCTNIVPTATQKALLLVKNLNAPAGDEKLVLKGFVTSVPSLPSINPVANGLRILVTDSLAGTPIDVTIPDGPYDPVTKTGWKVNGAGTSFKWKGPGTATNGVIKAQLRAIPSTPGRYKFKVTGKNGTYPVDTANLPLMGTIVIDVPFATTGQCGEASFTATPPAKPSCSVGGGGKLVKCK